MCLLVPRDDIGRLYDQAIELRGPAPHSLRTKHSVQIDTNSIQHFHGALVNRLRQCRQLRRCSWGRESHILGTTCIWILISPYQKVILVSRDARIQDNVDRGEHFRCEPGEQITIFVGPLGATIMPTAAPP